jgi:hypothetical protein
LALIERRLRDARFAESRLGALVDEVELWHGDFLESGRGEVFVPA